MSEPRITDDQARALWRRAAELQEAAEQALPAARALQKGAAAERGELSIDQVMIAAEGAGIDPEYMRMAVAEQRLPDATAIRHDDWKARWLNRVIREPHVLERERLIAASPAAVLTAFRSVARDAAFQLTPEDTVGTDPLSDAVLVYRITGSTSFGSTMNLADARVLFVTIRPATSGTMLRVRVPLFRRGVNLLVSGLFGTIFGAGIGGLTGGIASSLGATALVLTAPATLGVMAGGVLGVSAFRGLYRSIKGHGATALEQLLRAVSAQAEPTP